MKIIPYDRQAAVNYARIWAFSRNPAYYNFDKIGGDCTNFASQCIFAGAKIMNFTPVTGWYYISTNNRTASWTGVEYLYNFLTSNSGEGPFAEEVEPDKLEIGDIVQLGSATGDFYHSPVVVSVSGGRILVAAHTYDTYGKPLYSYSFAKARGIHILGIRKYG
ncbi:MAG: amidase domain-containing protein [Candidatus Coproplasma sp.]